ncbi:MAG TPA: ATP-binding protein [Acidimicrobiales bacterium]|nr:ATP-binding protein [Acidimicrobiales bacterium]
MAAVVVVVGLALGIAGVLLVSGLYTSQVSAIDRALRLEAASVASFARTGTLPHPIRSSSNEAAFIQVVDARGQVVASSQSLAGQDRIETYVPQVGALTIRTLSDLPLGSGGPFRLASLVVTTPTGPLTIYVGESLSTINGSVHDIVASLFVVDPLLLLIVGLTVWWLVGRALAPVEAIRAEVAEISSSALDRRVAEPVVKDEIGRLAVTMNDMLERLDRSSRRQRTFVADASHELRSPLAAAQTELEVGLAHQDTAVWPEVARDALGDLERVRRIVDDLVVLVQYDEGLIPVASAEVDLDDVVLDECRRLRRTTSVIVDTAKVSGARVIGDRERLGRAVRNLLDNAVRHADGRVDVELRQEDDAVELRVSDDGRGIAPENRVRIFNRFERVDSARGRELGGSGLGLAIVQEIAVAHGGTVQVTGDTPGAHFLVRFPSLPGCPAVAPTQARRQQG